MLKIFNDLRPFFEDCYRRISVREYAKIRGVSPPTASSILSYYRSEGLLLRDKYRNYILFYADKDSKDFVDLSRIYWRSRLKEIVSLIEDKLTAPVVVLFGSLSKAEVKPDSDVDLAIFASKRELDMALLEKKLNRKLQIFWFKSLKGVKNEELGNNIANGYILSGRFVI